MLKKILMKFIWKFIEADPDCCDICGRNVCLTSIAIYAGITLPKALSL